MINTKKIVSSGAALLTAALIFTGCSDDFLEDKQDYNKAVDVYSNYATAEAAIDGIYAWALSNSTGSFSWQYSSAGSSDDHSKATEEYSTLSIFVDGSVITTSSGLPSFLYQERKTSNNLYGWIFACNDALESIPASTGLSQEEKDKLMGQAYFFRAWVYYRLVKELGGVPIVTKMQNPISSEVEALTIPRSTTKACIDFICEDLQLASDLLPAMWGDNDFGRVTAGAALALQGRARLLYASPVFNRADDKSRWDLAYDSNKAAIEKLEASAFFELAYADNPGTNASNWAKMFSEFKSKEAVFVTLYNNVNKGTKTNPEKWNGWENAIRPINANGSGGKTPTNLMIDLFPMADGKKPGESSIAYNKEQFMLNRDPRFYRTFAFPGVYWKFSGDPTTQNTSTAIAYPYKGSDYALWNYVWYESAAKRDAIDQRGFSGDGLAENYKGIYIRKRSDDFDANTTPLYVFKTDKGNGFEQSASPYMEIRYAEVLLNFAEAACGANHYSEALEALRKIRKRVGYTGNCGLDDGLAGDRGKLFAAILYERQIELAYEGKRFDDMRRWMLWDGGVGQAALHSTWALTGFGGNTCTYLGVQPFNGSYRGVVEVRVTENNGVIGNATATDPYKDSRPAPWNLSTQTIEDRPDLVTFYTEKLVRSLVTADDGTLLDRKGDDTQKVVAFQPQYYIVGLKDNAQTNNPTLEQTIGWLDVIRGGYGTFDPIAE